VTTAAITTTTTSPTLPASCVIVVANKAQLRASHSTSSAVLGQASAGTYSVSERHGKKWYRIAGGWVKQKTKVTPQGC
jgi:hypothetical protein